MKEDTVVYSRVYLDEQYLLTISTLIEKKDNDTAMAECELLLNDLLGFFTGEEIKPIGKTSVKDFSDLETQFEFFVYITKE